MYRTNPSLQSLEKKVGGDEDYTAAVKGLSVAGSQEAALNLLTGSGPKADVEAFMPEQIKVRIGERSERREGCEERKTKRISGRLTSLCR